MSNFTRSILYSTSVLVAGLVAIFAIYSNVVTAPDGSNVAQISPAAGGSDLGISIDTPIDNESIDPQSLIGPESYDVDDAMQKAVDQIDSTINEFDAIESTTEDDKGTYYSTGTSYKVAGSKSEVDAALNAGSNVAWGMLNTKVTSQLSSKLNPGQLASGLNNAVNAGISGAAIKTNGKTYKKTWGCWKTKGIDTDGDGIDDDTVKYWTGCSGNNFYYNKGLGSQAAALNNQVKNWSNNTVNSVVSNGAGGFNFDFDIGEGSGYSDSLDYTFDPSTFTTAFDSALAGALMKAPGSVQGDLKDAIENELSGRVFNF